MHVMIDLETMGNRPDAPIVSIGAVAFDSQGVGRDFYRNVTLQSSVKSGAVIDPDTVGWWMRQSDQARAAFDKDAISLDVTLYHFRQWLKPDEVTGMWGNGAAFDNVILAESYKRLGLEAPWPFWTDRCYRTMKSLFSNVPIVRSGTHHNALDDARTQAEHLVAINAKHGHFL